MTTTTRQTFIGLPAGDLDHLAKASVVVIGVAEASPYDPAKPSHSAEAPAMLRAASNEFAPSLAQYDFDLNATMFDDPDDRRGMVDVGDVHTDPSDADGNRARIEHAIRQILDAGALPVVLGGDDSVPIPVLKAFEKHGPLTILQIDAHVDWGDVIQGNPVGYGSTMRRAAEFPWVTRMVQVGIRGLGSGGSWQHDDARAWGSTLITSYAVHREGLSLALDQIPAGGRCFISIDVDGLDPAVVPAVAMPTPGGLTYEDVIGLIKGTAAKATIVGLALVEYVPVRDDPYRMSALTSARIAAVTMGLMHPARQA